MRGIAYLALAAQACFAAEQRHAASGLVLAVDPPHLTVTISHAAIPDFMEAMAMPFHVRRPAALNGIHAGQTVAFTLVTDKNASWLDDIRVVEFDSPERDPMQASRLRLLDSVMSHAPTAVLKTGDPVPGFSLIDQSGAPVEFSQFAGRVVAIDFIYTRCPLPDYCFRLSNNFGRVQKRFVGNRDLVLLSITFDPVHDRPEVLARYARIWKADPAIWHFLTGPADQVQRLCDLFGVGHWQEDGAFTHSLHTAVVDRSGKLVANLEGNQFSAVQLGDLLATVLSGHGAK